MNAPTDSSARDASNRPAWIVAALFFAVSLPWLGSVAHYHGDERFYTDAALRMLADGDWLRPVYADGEPRLNKPLFSYWVLLATYSSLGIDLFLSRLPFLVAGALVVGLTGRLARLLFPADSGAPLLAALIVASDVEISILSRRSTPDILIVLFATVSLIGLARIVVSKEEGAAPRAWFWIGAGLSVATKGLWGVLSAVFGAIVMLCLRRERRSWRELIDITSMVIALVIAVAGLAGLFVARGEAGGPTFLEDQVASRSAESVSVVAGQAANYAGSIAKHFVPWIALLAVGLCVDRRAVAAAWRAQRSRCVFALGWLTLLFCVFSLSNTHRGRYLAPAHPLLACAVAAILWRVTDSSQAGRVVRGFAGVTIAAIGGSCLVLALVFARIDVPVASSLGACAVIAGLAAAGFRSTVDGRPLIGLGIGLLAIAPLGVEALRGLVDPSSVPAAWERLRAMAASERSPAATLGFSETTASQLRVVSGNRIDPSTLSRRTASAQLSRYRTVLAKDAGRAALEDAGFRLERCGHVVPNLSARDVWLWLSASNPRAWLAARGKPVWFARRE